jgi:tryptophan halogenase
VLADGERIVADLFVDTTPDGRLIGATRRGAWIDGRPPCPATAWPCARSRPAPIHRP